MLESGALIRLYVLFETAGLAKLRVIILFNNIVLPLILEII
jgi:hypothetical protein